MTAQGGNDAGAEDGITTRCGEVHQVLTHHDMEQVRRRRPPVAAGWLSLCAAALLSGCAVGPKYVKPVTSVNPDWSGKSDARLSTQTPADSAWWRAFNDPALDGLVQRAYHQNLSLQVAGLRIMEARAQLGIAVGNQYPQLQAAFGSATGVQGSKHAANGALPDRNYWDYQLGFDAAWEIDFWRKFAKGVQAAEAGYLASVADYDDALVSLTAEVARTYAVIRTFEVLLDQARQNVTVQEEGQRIAQSRFRNGATSELDVSQATTLLENTRSTIPQLEASLQQAENAMSTLLGQPTGAVRALLGVAGPIPAAPPQVSVSVPTEMLRRRPDIRSAELTAVAQAARVGIATADLYPSFSLFGEIGYQTTSGAGKQSNNASFSNLFDPGSLFFFYGPRLVWPLFNYGRIRNNVRVEDARLQQSLVAYQNTVLRAAQEAEDGMAGFLRAEEATTFAQNAATAAKRSVDLAFIQYREGAVDFQRVLDAQRSLLQEQNGLAQTRSSATTSLIALYKALGGGWEMRRGQPFVADSTRIQMQHRTNWGNLFSEPQVPATSTQKSHKR